MRRKRAGLHFADQSGAQNKGGIMNVSITFRNLESTEALKQHIEDKVRKVRKYLQGPIDAHVVLSVERYLHEADVTINAGSMTFKGKEEQEDMYTCIDKVMDKIEKQIRRTKDRARSNRNSSGEMH